VLCTRKTFKTLMGVIKHLGTRHARVPLGSSGSCLNNYVVVVAVTVEVAD